MNLDSKENFLNKLEIDINTINSERHLIDDIQPFFDNHGYVSVGKNDILKTNIKTNNLDVDISFMKNNAENRAFRPIYSNRFIIGKIIIFFKRTIRKLLKWYIEPICDQQTVFNNSTTSAFETLRFELGGVREDNLRSIDNCLLQISEIKDILESNNSLSSEIKELRNDNNSLSSEIKELRNDNNSLSSEIKELRNDNNSLSSEIKEIKKQQEESKPQYAFGNVVSSSQSGEDMIIAYILDALRIPFNECTYLDLGANHAKAMSNSYMLYRFGARGVLVEANPNLISELKKERRGDLILNNCVTIDKSASLTFYIMSGDGLSTSDYNRVQEVININPNIYIEDKIDVKAITIDDIFKNYFSEVPMLVNIDIEGIELEILKQFDLKRRRPLIFVVETVPYSCDFKILQKDQDIIHFMETMGYVEYAFTGINSIFVDSKRLRNYVEDRRDI